jgi:hypothetical protein
MERRKFLAMLGMAPVSVAAEKSLAMAGFDWWREENPDYDFSLAEPSAKDYADYTSFSMLAINASIAWSWKQLRN